MMLFGPGVKNITVANMTKAIRSECDMAASRDLRQNLFFEACGRFDSSMMAMPPTTVTMPASRSGPKFSPNTMLDAAEPTNGTRSANGTTCAAG